MFKIHLSTRGEDGQKTEINRFTVVVPEIVSHLPTVSIYSNH